MWHLALQRKAVSARTSTEAVMVWKQLASLSDLVLHAVQCHASLTGHRLSSASEAAPAMQLQVHTLVLEAHRRAGAFANARFEMFRVD